MSRGPLLHLDGPMSDDGPRHLEETVAFVLESARSGHLRPLPRIDGRRLHLAGPSDDDCVEVELEGDPGRRAPRREDVPRILVEALARPHADEGRMRVLRLEAGAVAAFADTEAPCVMVAGPTPWQSACVHGCPAPKHGRYVAGPATPRLSRSPARLGPGVAALLPDVVTAVYEDGRLTLRPARWTYVREAAGTDGGTDAARDAALPDPMTALRVVRSLREDGRKDRSE